MILTAEPFALYSTTWWSYIGLGVLFMALVWWKIRHWSFYPQMLLLTLLSAGAFSFSLVPNADTYAPAVISLILELETEGSEGEIRMLTHLTLVWLILVFLSIAIRYGWQYVQQQKAQQQKQHASSVNNSDDRSVDQH